MIINLACLNKRSKILIILSLLVLIFPLSAQEMYNSENYFPNTNIVLVGAEYGYPPYSIVNDAGEADGFSVQLITEALSSMGLEAEYITGSWAEVKEYPSKGVVQALPLVGRRPERESVFDFTFPYLSMHGTILVSEDEQNIDNLTDLAGKRVAVMEGDNAEEFVRNMDLDAKIVATKTFEDALTGLSQGEFDAVIIQKLLAYQLMNNLGIANIKTTGVPLADFVQDFCFAVDEGNGDLLEVLNEGLSIVIANGIFRKLYTEWFGPIELRAKQFDRIIVGGDSDYPPYEFLDDNGQPTGYNVELTQAIADRMNVSIEIELAPWSKTIQSLEDHSLDIVQGVFYSADRDALLNFSQPHTIISHVIITRTDEIKQELLTLEDLAGLTILVMKGDLMEDIVSSYGYSGQIITADSQEEVLRQLSRGTADCALVAQVPALYWIEKNNWKNLMVGKAAIISPDYCYAVLEENDDLLMLFSEGLAALKSTGEYREIYDRWFGVYEDSTPDIWETIKTILFIVIPLMVIVVFAILWTWILRRQVLKQTIEIKKNKDMLERITDTSPVGILVTNRAGVFTFVNSAAEKILGLPRDEILKRTYNDSLWEITDIDFHSIADEDQPSFLSYHKKEEVFDSPQWITRPDGIRKLLSVSTSPLKDEAGGVTAVVEVLADITKQYFSEAAIHKEKEQLSITLQSIADGIVTTDNEGKILRMNEVAEKLTGWTISEAAGKPFNSLCRLKHQITGKQIDDIVSRVLITGRNEEKTNQLLLVSHSGMEKLVGISCALIKGSSEHILGAVLVIHDLTEGQKMQDYIQKTAKLDSLGILAGGIAHDFNNLLGGLFGYIEMAKQVSDDVEKVNHYLDESLIAFDRAKNLTMQLLTFSKGGNPIRKADSLKNLIQHCSTFSLSGSKSSCTYSISEDLWLCDFDENQMGQVFDNLIINAQQAMPKGGEISISARNVHLTEGSFVSFSAGDYIQISIQDTGNGIEPDEIKQIFDPFYTTKEKGTGLGLATCYSIIKKHDGIIDVKSRLGVGTVFDIYLPKSVSQLKAVTAEREFEVNHRGVGIIVIMDDEELIRTIVGKMVKSMGYDVIEAKNGKEVLQLCDKFHETGNPVIGALFDLTIPGGMGGKETVAICRKKFPDIPIFASSGYSSDPIMSDPEKYGFTASICKPYRFQELKTLFNTHLLQKK